ncbi:hypothetical protein Pint_09788 [Pistacia integerrima]|uniref:Uncharacterized protein n=1 Tax=Pistacia integerrima TaxID=434235 RepID=A0ACC0XLS3_9ROSI|nr:hypothetical protein Pint_09788 [Pistacia integerrima]
MDEPGDRTVRNRMTSNVEKRAKYAEDAAHDGEHSNSGSNDSVSESMRFAADLSTTFRIFSESLLRKELDELEMMKSREALRCEAEKRRVETEAESTQMLAQTQLQIASFVAGMSSSSKRKRVEEDESPPVSQRQILYLKVSFRLTH